MAPRSVTARSVTARSVTAPQLARLLPAGRDSRPYYAALADAVRDLVLDGRLPVRTRLPAERDLARALAISRTTVTAAYDELRSSGHLESHQGSGSWVRLPGGRAGRAGGALVPDDTLIDLGMAAPAPAPAALAGAVAAAAVELGRYADGHGYEPAGLAVLRDAIAQRYTARGLPTRPEQIIVTNGAQQGFTLLLSVLAGPGDAICVESPTFPHALDAARRAALRLVPAGLAETGWDLDLTGAAMRQGAARLVYVIADFHNPTGLLMDEATRAGLVALARRCGAYVIADETWAELDIDPEGGTSPAPAAVPAAAPAATAAMPAPVAAHDGDSRVCSVGSLSKLCWGGLRVGWVRAPVPVIRRLVQARAAVDLASPVLEQLVAVELLAATEQIRAERRAELRERRDALAEVVRERLPQWRFRIPAGGSSVWARLPEPVSTDLAAAAQRHGVRLVPGPAFGVDGTLERFVRLPFMLPAETLRTAAARLEAAYADVTGGVLATPAPALV
jgi:DNA-binding transcriptional MocR family regulator